MQQHTPLILHRPVFQHLMYLCYKHKWFIFPVTVKVMSACVFWHFTTLYYGAENKPKQHWAISVVLDPICGTTRNLMPMSPAILLPFVLVCGKLGPREEDTLQFSGTGRMLSMTFLLILHVVCLCVYCISSYNKSGVEFSTCDILLTFIKIQH